MRNKARRFDYGFQRLVFCANTGKDVCIFKLKLGMNCRKCRIDCGTVGKRSGCRRSLLFTVFVGYQIYREFWGNFLLYS